MGINSWTPALLPYSISFLVNGVTTNYTNVSTSSNDNKTIHLVTIGSKCQNASIETSSYAKINSIDYFKPSQFPVSNVNSGAYSIPSTSGKLPFSIT